MVQIGTIQVAGNSNLGPAEVEVNTLALRAVIRPDDLTPASRVAFDPGNFIIKNGAPTSAVAWSNNNVFTLWPTFSNFLLIRGVYVSLLAFGTSIASSYTLSINIARGMQLLDLSNSGAGVSQILGMNATSPSGDSLTPTSIKIGRIFSNRRNNQNQNIALAWWPTSGAGQTALAFIGGAGTQPVVDAQDIAAISSSNTVASQQIFPSRTPLFEAKAGDHPLIIGSAEAMLIQINSSTADTGSGTIEMSVGVVFDELPTNLSY